MELICITFFFLFSQKDLLKSWCQNMFSYILRFLTQSIFCSCSAASYAFLNYTFSFKIAIVKQLQFLAILILHFPIMRFTLFSD